MTSRQVKKVMISRSAKGAYTAPEIRFNDYQISRRMNLKWDTTYPFVAPNRDGVLQTFDFQLDFINLTAFGGFNQDFEIDGDGHKQKNDKWKDEAKANAGVKTIHIPGELTKKKWWSYLDEQIPKSLLSEQRSVYISG